MPAAVGNVKVIAAVLTPVVGAVVDPFRNRIARRLATADVAPAGYNPTQSNALPGPLATVAITFWAGSAVVTFSAMLGAFTVTLTGGEVVLTLPLLAVKLKASVTGAAPAATVGAVNVVTA